MIAYLETVICFLKCFSSRGYLNLNTNGIVSSEFATDFSDGLSSYTEGSKSEDYSLKLELRCEAVSISFYLALLCPTLLLLFSIENFSLFRSDLDLLVDPLLS